MSDFSKIEWTESTWNPVTGCKKISAACQNCYAETFALRFKGVQGHPYEQGFDIKLWPERLNLPLLWKKPRLIFICSMSDIFLDEVPEYFREAVFKTMHEANWHIYQILTKRADKMYEWFQKYDEKINPVPSHLWTGVSVENQSHLDRIEYLKRVPSEIKFVSFEPLLGPIDLTTDLLKGINWVIVGGESGTKARRMHEEWVDSIWEICSELKIPFFFKQWGTYDIHGKRLGKKKAGRIYKGTQWNEMPPT
jgi:protein gp37